VNDFNKGIEYAFDFLEKHIIGRVVNGRLEGIITKDELEELRKKIPKKCDFCTAPCETDWCSTKDENE
jgi:hypothetical protein